AEGHRRDDGVAALLRVARPRVHLALRAARAGEVRGDGRGAAVLRIGGPGRRPEGLPVRRGAEGRAEAVGVQGLRHRLHAGDADRDLHGLPRGRLCRLLQLRADEPQPRTGGRGSGGPAMSAGSGWIEEALREHDHAERPENPDGRPSLPVTDREQQVLDRIDRARRRRPRVREERITMSHGAGGKATHTLIEAIFLDAFRNPLLEPLEDAAELRIPVPGAAVGARVALTTDSYV